MYSASFVLLLLLQGVNLASSSRYGGLFQPGCLLDQHPGFVFNGACTYVSQPTSRVSDCMSGFWKYHDSSDASASSKFYCGPSCSQAFGFTPNYLTRECTPANPMANMCSLTQYRPTSSDSCQACPAHCLDCDSTGTTCYSCANGYYFDVAAQQCLAKSAPPPSSVLRLFVAAGSEPSSPNSHSGQADDPFFDLRDALSYANEVAAPFTTYEVVVYLEKGIHYITLRDEATQGYEQGARDWEQMEYDLTI